MEYFSIAFGIVWAFWAGKQYRIIGMKGYVAERLIHYRNRRIAIIERELRAKECDDESLAASKKRYEQAMARKVDYMESEIERLQKKVTQLEGQSKGASGE